MVDAEKPLTLARRRVQGLTAAVISHAALVIAGPLRAPSAPVAAAVVARPIKTPPFKAVRALVPRAALRVRIAAEIAPPAETAVLPVALKIAAFQIAS